LTEIPHEVYVLWHGKLAPHPKMDLDVPALVVRLHVPDRHMLDDYLDDTSNIDSLACLLEVSVVVPGSDEEHSGQHVDLETNLETVSECQPSSVSVSGVSEQWC